MRVESDLKATEAEEARQVDAKGKGDATDEPNDRFERQILAEFRRDPEAIALEDEIASANEESERLKKIYRQRSDPSRLAAEAKFKRLKHQHEKLWNSKYLRVRDRVLSTANAETAALRRKLESLKDQYAKQLALLKAVEVETKK